MKNKALSEKANNYRYERIKNVLSQSVIPNLRTDNSLFIHIIPFGFSNYQILDFPMALRTNMKPMYATDCGTMYNIDGFSTFSTTYDNQSISSYNQIFKNGVYEMYSSDLFYETEHDHVLGFNGVSFITEAISNIRKGLFVLNKMTVKPPFLISFSFHNVLDKIMDHEDSTYARKFKQNEVILPFITTPGYRSNIANLLKPNFDILWQYFDFSESPYV